MMSFTALREVADWVGELERLTQTGKCGAPRFLKPFHFVLLGLALRRNGSCASLALPDKLQGYAARMHLWTALDLEPPVQVTEYPCHGFHPLQPLIDQAKVDETCAALTTIFHRNEADPQTINSAEIAVQEILGNCFAHAEISGFHGLACAQTWVAGNKAQIAIGDGGIGIRESLSRNDLYSIDLRHRNACEFATQYEVTSKPGRGHSGYGLTLARELTANNGGAFFVLSHDEYFCSRAGKEDRGTLDVPLRGTLIVLEWDTSVPLDVGRVYDSWPSSDGDDDDEIFR